MSVTIHNMNLPENVLRIMRSTHDIEFPRPKGLKRFEIGNQIIWALNRKNAERKAKLYPDKEVIGG